MNYERKRILKMVEEGKLTVDEALTLLEGMDKGGTKQPMATSDYSKINFEEAKKEEYSAHKFQSAKEKIFEFVDTALKKIKDLDLDFNFGQSIEVSHIFQQADTEINEMDIEVANGSLRVIPWDQKDVRIECHAKVYRVDTQDEAREQFMRDVYFHIDSGKLRFNTQQKWMKVDAVAYIPQTQYEKVKIRLFNGPVTSEELTVNEYKIKTANGKIELAGIYGKKLDVETANGQIQVKRSRIDRLEAETINGAIKLDGDYERVELQSFNGNLTCNLDSSRCEYVTAKAVTGSVEVLVPEGIELDGELKTNLGGFNVLLDGVHITEEKSEVVQKMLRFKSVQPSEHKLKVYAETKTGSVNIKKADAFSSKK